MVVYNFSTGKAMRPGSGGSKLNGNCRRFPIGNLADVDLSYLAEEALAYDKSHSLHRFKEDVSQAGTYRFIEEELQREQPRTYELREKFFQVLEQNLGERGMTQRNILGAIKCGIGESYILQLQQASRNGGGIYLLRIVARSIARAIMGYVPKDGVAAVPDVRVAS